MLTEEAMSKLNDHNTELTLDDRGDIADLLMDFELFRQHTITRAEEVLSASYALKRS